MRCFCITILLYSILFIFNSCTCDNMAGTIEGLGNSRIPLVVHATISSFGNLPVQEKPMVRTPTENGFETQFNTGDAIGIFAVKNGAILDEINNIKLTYSEINGKGVWTPPANTTLYWYDGEGVSYIAYYPYKDGVTINASQSNEDILKSLAANDLLAPITDQSDAEKYTSSDLMTAIGTLTVDTKDPYKKILSLNFKHQFTLLVLQPQVHVGCFESVGAVFKYRNLSTTPAIDKNVKSVIVNGVNACRMGNGSYRAIVLPNEAKRISGSYTTTDRDSNNKTVTYSGSETSFTAGNCYTLTVNSQVRGEGSTTRELAPGDFVFHGNNGIEVYPGDGLLDTNGKIPGHAEAVGMVITCDPVKMTDLECKAKGWDHAYVMGLDNIKDSFWGPNDSINEPIPEMTKNDQIEYNMNGYSETKTMLNTHTSNLEKYGAFKLIKEYREQNPVPASVNRSPWFIPSIGQWFDMLVNICGRNPRDFKFNLEDHDCGSETLSKLENQLAKVGRATFDFKNFRYMFLCSTEYDAKQNWIIIWHIGDTNPEYSSWDRIGLKGFAKNSEYHVRPFFAF